MRDRFLQLLQLCVDKRSLVEGRRAHGEIRKHGMLEDGPLGSAIVRMYIKCRSPRDAQLVFDRMLDRSMVLWTTMVAGYVSSGDSCSGWKTFRGMQQEGVLPEKVTFISILNACTGLQQGKLIHSLAMEKGLDSDVAVANALVKMYGKCRHVDSMVAIFDKMPERDVISWTGMVTAFAQNGHRSEAFVYYLRMSLEGIKPSRVSFLAVLGVCSSIQQVKMIHGNVLEAEVEHDNKLANALVFAYSRCGSLQKAWDVFDEMELRDIVTWNTMISACTQHGFCFEALELFERMQLEQRMIPDVVTVVSVLGACTDLAQGKALEVLVTRNALERDVIVGTALLNMYCKCGSLSDAHRVFQKIGECRNIVSWNMMLASFARDEVQFNRVIEVFREMLLLGLRPTEMTFVYVLNAVRAVDQGRLVSSCSIEAGFCSDLFVCNSLVTMFGRCRSIEDACSVFSSMPKRDVVSWNGMLSAFIEQGFLEEATDLFSRMQLEGAAGNKITFLVMLNAFTSTAALQAGKKLHAHIRESGYESQVLVGNAIMSMYSKCGCFGDALTVFQAMQERTVVSWTTIIAACTQYGFYEQALQLFQDMDVVPDKVTLVSALEACTLGSTQDQGRQIHDRAVDLGLELDVFVGTALVHMYSKFGNMEQAAALFGRLPLLAVPSWNAMIGGYAQSAELTKARQVFWEMQQNGATPDQISFLSVVSACGHAGLVEDGLRTFASMTSDYNMAPILENYSCLIDLLARAGRLQDADDFLKRMPCRPSDGTWKALLSGCRVQGDLLYGKTAVNRVLEMDPWCPGAHVELSNLLSTELSKYMELAQVKHSGSGPEPAASVSGASAR